MSHLWPSTASRFSCCASSFYYAHLHVSDGQGNGQVVCLEPNDEKGKKGQIFNFLGKQNLSKGGQAEIQVLVKPGGYATCQPVHFEIIPFTLD